MSSVISVISGHFSHLMGITRLFPFMDHCLGQINALRALTVYRTGFSWNTGINHCKTPLLAVLSVLPITRQNPYVYLSFWQFCILGKIPEIRGFRGTLLDVKCPSFPKQVPGGPKVTVWLIPVFTRIYGKITDISGKSPQFWPSKWQKCQYGTTLRPQWCLYSIMSQSAANP